MGLFWMAKSRNGEGIPIGSLVDVSEVLKFRNLQVAGPQNAIPFIHFYDKQGSECRGVLCGVSRFK